MRHLLGKSNTAPDLATITACKHVRADQGASLSSPPPNARNRLSFKTLDIHSEKKGIGGA